MPEQDGAITLKRIFPTWSTHENKMSIVLALTTVAAHLASWWFTRRSYWLCSSALAGAVLPWSVFPMGEFVTTLRTGKDHIDKAMQKYSFYHHFKTMSSLAAFVVVLVNTFRPI